MKKVAFLCPGQGAQSVGMAVDLVGEFAEAAGAFEEASEALGEDLLKLCREGPEEALTRTANAQPALLTTSAAVARVLAAGGVEPVVAAGHSLGEWSALVAVGALALGPAVRAVRERGRFMQEAVPEGVGAMSALIGLTLERATEICADVSDGSTEGLVVPANLNGEKQVVVAGHLAAVVACEAAATELGAKVSRLKVSAPFHSPLMRPARDRMEAVVGALEFGPFRAPIVSNVDAEPNEDGNRAAALLLEQITAPVRWVDCAREVASRADLAIEVGSGRVLAGLMRRIERGFSCHATGEPAQLRKALEAVQ